ncbi:MULTISPECIES: ABC transporter permease [Rhodococcus erythropolis group]|jgi:ABC-2 type transport system permease protein|uniref:ABC transporter permease n=1 Tax=Rhodococcus erythropolis group TaxID=2840174 RepID=UPI00087800AF|nr:MULTISPECIES: ABC transporter permease [Rhodococcus erythropolis group]MBW4818204.1 ABC transporter permease [Rhodococcus qingshengii]OFV78049.1 ABC-2 family transporter protein [Rhodococcus erythropolis]
MNVTLIRTGLARGGIELRQLYTNAPDLIGQFLTPAISLVVLFLLRNKMYGDSGMSVAELAVPGLLGSIIAFNGMYSLLNVLVLDREDGTLLRAKAVPRGVTGYFVGKIVASAGSVIVQVVVVLGVGIVIIGGSSLSGPGAVATFVWVVALGLLAVLPFGAILGSVLDTRTAFLLTMPLMGLIAISGIFYPITALPGWLQAVGQSFPMYWLGLGMRSALLPEEAVAIEIGESWRHVETAAVLGVWAVVGLLIAPVVLRRMARHESGSNMAARREKALQRAF